MSDPHLGFVMDKKIARGNAQLLGPEMKARRTATHAPPEEGVDAAISARTAGERSRDWGQESTEGKEKLRWGLVSAAKERELGSWAKFEEAKLV